MQSLAWGALIVIMFWDNDGMSQPLSLPELERAINYWRTQIPATGEESRLCAQAAALAEPYALMIVGHLRDLSIDDLSPKARAAFDEANARDTSRAAPTAETLTTTL